MICGTLWFLADCPFVLGGLGGAERLPDLELMSGFRTIRQIPKVQWQDWEQIAHLPGFVVYCLQQIEGHMGVGVPPCNR